MAEKPVRKYPKLSANFFRGTFVGQVTSVVKTLETNPEKAAQFLQAIKEGAIKVPSNTGCETLPVRTIKGLKRLGVHVAETVITIPATEDSVEVILRAAPEPVELFPEPVVY